MTSSRKDLILGLNAPVSAAALCSYFDTFGDIGAVDLSGMFGSDLSSESTARITYFDSRAPLLAVDRLKDVTSLSPKVVAVDPNGTGEPVSISISHISLQERARSNVGASGEADVGNLRWKVGETLNCCEKFGDIELINGQLTSEPTLHSDTLATTVTFYDTRVANKFRRVLRSVQGVGRTTEKTPAEATTHRRATVPIATSEQLNEPSGGEHRFPDQEAPSLPQDPLRLPSVTVSTTLSAQQHLENVFREYDEFVYSLSNDEDFPDHSGTPREATTVGAANPAETLAAFIGRCNESGETLEKFKTALGEGEMVMCDSIKEWGKHFIPHQTQITANNGVISGVDKVGPPSISVESVRSDS